MRHHLIALGASAALTLAGAVAAVGTVTMAAAVISAARRLRHEQHS